MMLRAMLGPQRRSPNLGTVLDDAHLPDGPVCVITAGWQEREGELADLKRHLGRVTRDLQLYRRAESVFEDDPEFRRAYRNRQAALKELQRLYRRRLAHAGAAYAEMMSEPGDGPLLRNERRAALRALRTLDRQHLRRIQHILDAFEATTGGAVAGLARHQGEIREIVDDSVAVLVAGGHVQLLLNRLRLFGLAEMLESVPVIAWSAGAMALSDRVILFHDHPPQGAGIAEICDCGLGLFPGIVPLPHAGERLRLNDVGRVSLFARRFAPARCLTLDGGATLIWRGGVLMKGASTSRLTPRGSLQPERPQ